MKGEYRLRILEFIEGAAQAIDDIFYVFILPYGTSYARMDYLLEKRRENAENHVISKHERRRFSDFIYRLQKDGLATKVQRKGKYSFKLTSRGRDALDKIRGAILPIRRYKCRKDNTLKIVIFDIPEREKRKREWLRWTLKNLGFNMLQKSVWAGKIGLPEEFLKDLDKINILSFVEIFAISKTGSLREIINK